MLAGTVTGDGRTADGIWLRGVFLPVGVSNQYTGGMWRYPVGGGYTIDFQFPYSLDGVTQIAAQALNPDGNATIATSPYISVCVN